MGAGRRTFNEAQNGFNDSLRGRADKSVGRLLSAIGFSANGATLTGFMLCMGAAVIWSFQTRAPGLFWWALPVFLLGALFDLFDGSVARVRNTKTLFGEQLDTACDKVVEATAVAALVWVITGSVAAVLAVAATAGSIMVSYMRTRAEKLGLNGKVGFGDRLVRLVAVGICVLIGHWYGGFVPALGVLNALAWPTAVWRLLSIRKQLLAQGTP